MPSEHAIIKRDDKGRLLPGQSGNPGGRPKGLAVKAREATKDGEDLIAFWLRVLNDDSQRIADRLTAAQSLADRGWGKATQPVAGDGDMLAMGFLLRTAGLSDAEVAQLEAEDE